MPSSPSPETTLAVILGASEFPKQQQLTPSKAFFQSAADLKRYLLSSEGLALSIENVLDLFDSDKDPNKIDEEVEEFLVSRQTHLKKRQLDARDVIIYYVGHGGFAGPGNDYFLALRSTRSGNELISSYAITTLANTLREHASFLRKYLILDSCFSAAAYASFQSAPLEVAKRKTLEEFPGKGTALLCAAGPKDPAKLLPGQVHTMFSGALLYVLEKGSSEKSTKLSFFDIGELTRSLIKERFPGKAVRPELHSPDQKQGDVVVIPFFPNPAKKPEVIDDLRHKLTVLSDEYEELKKRYQGLESSTSKSNGRSTTQPTQNPPILKHDIFLSSPMAALPSAKEYEANRKLTLKLIDAFRVECGFENIFYAGRDIRSTADFEPEGISIKEDLKAIEESRYFVMIYPSKVVTSALVEAGCALALRKPSLYFIRSEDDLPFLLKQAMQAFVDVKIYKSKNIKDVIRLVCKQRLKLFGQT